MQWAAVAALALALAGLGAWNVVLNQALNAPPERYAMAGTGSMAAVTGTVTEYRRQDVAVVSLTGMPQPAPGKVYQLWLVDVAGRVIPGAVFTPAPDGTARVTVDRPLSSVRSVAVTQEAGPSGARRPSQKPELAGQLGP